MSLYVFNIYCLDTTPGNRLSPFSPSKAWQGEDEDYIVWLRERFKTDPGLRQRLAISARANARGERLQIMGRYNNRFAKCHCQFWQKKLKSGKIPTQPKTGTLKRSGFFISI